MKFFTVATVMLLATAVHTASAHDLLKHLGRFHCDGTIEILPSLGFGTSFQTPLLANMVNSVIDSVHNRAQCLCGSDPTFEEDFNLMFDPVIGVLNAINDVTELPTSSCIPDNFARSLLDLAGFFDVQIADTCTYDTWKNSGHCSFQLCLAEFDLCLKVAASSCTGSRLPTVAFACEGPGCSYLSACRTSNDCDGGVECEDMLTLFTNVTFTDDEVADLMFDVFGFLYWNETESPGCFQERRGTGPRTPNNDILARLTTVMYNNLFGWSGSFASPRMCMSPLMLNLREYMWFNGTIDDVLPVFVSDDFFSVSSVDQEYPSCLSNETNTLSFTYFQSFSGYLDDQTPLFNPAPIFNLPTADTSNGIPILHVDCDGGVNFANQMFSQFGNQWMPSVDAMADLIEDLMACTTSPTWSKNQFIARYMPLNPVFFLSLLDAQGKFNVGPESQESADDLRNAILWYFDIKIKNLPCSASLNHYLSEGSMSLNWSGLSQLMSMDLDINLSVTECPGSTRPAIKATCVGAACAATMGGIAACDMHSDCMMFGSGFKCVDMVSEIMGLFPNTTNSEIFGRDVWLRNNTGNSTDDSSAGWNWEQDTATSGVAISSLLLLGLGIGDVDVMAGLFHPDFNEDACASPNITGAFGFNDTCFSTEMWRWDVHNIIMNLFGVPNSPQVSTPLNFCSFDPNILDGDRLESWANSLYTLDNSNFDRVSLNYMYGDYDDFCPAPAGGSDSSSSSASVLTYSWSMMVMLLVAVLALFA